jgi:nitrogenase molybdenum-iron protein alpha/beta subunit
MTYGPIDFLALVFKKDQLKGEIMPELLELVKNKVVRVIDLVIIQKDENGHHQALEMQQLSPDLLAVFDPLGVEISGMIQVEDIDNVAEVMENGTNAALLLFENLWAIKFKEAVLRANGQLIAQERIPFEVVNEALEIFASAESTK